MKNEFVDYPLALRMKTLGYNEPCLAYFLNSILQCTVWEKDYSYFNEMSDINPSLKKHEHVLAPTLQSAFRWFREEYDLHYLRPTKYSETKWWGIGGNTKVCDSYEEAELACLEKLCEIVEKRKEDGKVD